MKHFNDFQFTVDEVFINDLLKSIRDNKESSFDRSLLTSLFSLIDLTRLGEKDNAENIGNLCEQVNTLDDAYPGLPNVAALCVYPELIPIARARLSNPLVNLASVGGGFPASQTFLEIKITEIEMAVQAGAEEIDMVLPVGKFLLGLLEEVFEEIKTIREKSAGITLKVILETGSLEDLTLVRKASLLSMDAGADFIKTSTGKAGTGATPDAFAVMCHAVMDYYNKTGKKIGVKPAGGIATAESAVVYYRIVESILGQEWLNPEKFRIGASRLANEILARIFEKDENFSYFQ